MHTDNLKQQLQSILSRHPSLAALFARLRQQRIEVWLVGGCLRDLLLERDLADIDIVVSQDPTSLLSDLARHCRGRWFWLDKKRLQGRILLPDQLTVDLSPLRAETLVGDLKLRDFTINAMALPIGDDCSSQQLCDPLNALVDLQQGRLAFCHEHSIADDPLRMLKGVRHAACLDMHLTPQSLELIRSNASSIKQSAAERVGDELGKIFNCPDPQNSIQLLLETGLLPEILGPFMQDWSEGSLRADLKRITGRIDKGGLAALPGESGRFSLRGLFVLVTLLRHYEPQVKLEEITADRLRLSRRQQQLVRALLPAPTAKLMEQISSTVTLRQKALAVEALGSFPAEQLCYWSALHEDPPAEQLPKLLGAYFKHLKQGRVPDLLDGLVIGKLLRCSGEQVGTWQQRVKQAELDGEILDAESAAIWLQNKISD